MQQTTPVKFRPIGEQVLVKMDVKKKSILEIGVNDSPKMLPSGVVIATGCGEHIPGCGLVPCPVEPGEHVSIAVSPDWKSVRLDSKPDVYYILVPQRDILGVLTDAGEHSPWYQDPMDASKVALA